LHDLVQTATLSLVGTAEAPHNGLSAPFDLRRRVALVTGAGRGIGRATALLLARCGAAVVVNDLVERAAQKVAAEIGQLGALSLAVPGDVSNAESVEALHFAVSAAHLDVDLLVNNAGISAYRPILECSEDDWDRHLDIMAKGTFLMIRAFAPGMVARRFGRIVNLGSYVAQGNCATKNFGPYCAAKYAVVGLTEVAAQELAPHVTVNAVGPGDVATEMMEEEWRQEGERRGLDAATVKEEYRKRLLLRDFEQPDDIAGAVAFLCSPLASQITGSHLIISGGLPYKVAGARS
jgi:NAD(P)-dependent dehydrogenase (short-subunit alcohol dehydrogenase family)